MKVIEDTILGLEKMYRNYDDLNISKYITREQIRLSIMWLNKYNKLLDGLIFK